MFQIRTQSDSELLRGQLHAAQHPFDDVAVVAEQTSGSVGVVAVVGSDLSASKVSSANSASVILVNEKLGDFLFAHARSLAALGINYFRPRRRVVSDLRIPDGGPTPTFGTLAERPSALSGFGTVAVFLAARFDLWALTIGPLFGAGFVQVSEAAQAVRFKILRPLFRTAISFSHFAYATPNAPGLNRAVVSKEIFQ